MTIRAKKALKVTLAFAVSITACACTTSAIPGGHQSADFNTAGQKIVTLNIKHGRVFQLIAPIAKAAPNPSRANYYSTAIPLARSHGYTTELQLNIVDTIAGNFEPDALVFATWPSADAYRAFSSEPDWPELKATRPDAWTELKIYSAVLERDLSLRFDPLKFYAVAIAESPKVSGTDGRQLEQYLATSVRASAGRILYQTDKPEFEAHATRQLGPDTIMLIEWQSEREYESFRSGLLQEASSRFGDGSSLEIFNVVPKQRN